jgi:AcrR family transcriptional regulator
MRRTLEQAALTRERIFRAGVKVFSERGFNASRLEDIAREAGTTRGAIYWHFKNKEAFFHEIYKRVSEKVERISEDIVRSNQALQALRGAMTTVLRDFVEDEEWRQMQSLLIKTGWLDHVRHLQDMGVPQAYKKSVEEKIRGWVARGELRPVSDPSLIFQAVQAYMMGITSIDIEEKAALTADRVGELVELLVQGLAPR